MGSSFSSMFIFPAHDVCFCSSDLAVSVVPILGHAEPCQSSEKAFQPLLKVVVVLLCKGMAQISILHPCEMHMTAQCEILAVNVAKTDSM